MTKVKICGITRQEDAELAIELGADYLGFIFVKESPRYVAAPPATRGVLRVGVFRGASPDEILRTAEAAKLDLVQIHETLWSAEAPPPLSYSGTSARERANPKAEAAASALQIALPVIHAVKVGDTLPETNTEADYILFDTGGGTGRTFDWDLLAGYPRTKPFFLAGGIHPDNVADAIAQTHPFAVDVSSGVESAPGIKDHDKLRRFFEAMNR
jgi:phosphoribosylanthranilate isomerase